MAHANRCTLSRRPLKMEILEKVKKITRLSLLNGLGGLDGLERHARGPVRRVRCEWRAKNGMKTVRGRDWITAPHRYPSGPSGAQPTKTPAAVAAPPKGAEVCCTAGSVPLAAALMFLPR